MTGVPQHRWRQFVDDCNNFLSTKQAERAAELGWNARHLFGSRRDRPLMHPGGAGLLWAINGGRLVELHRDWAVIDSWIDGVARLEHHRPLTDIPPHRWRQFLSDCNNFLTGGENWAGRAAELGWNAASLFGCRRDRPLAHPGGAGLLWAIQGGRLVELHRDWAVIELAANGSRRVFERRRVDAGKVTLPWIGRGRRPAGGECLASN